MYSALCLLSCSVYVLGAVSLAEQLQPQTFEPSATAQPLLMDKFFPSPYIRRVEEKFLSLSDTTPRRIQVDAGDRRQRDEGIPTSLETQAGHEEFQITGICGELEQSEIWKLAKSLDQKDHSEEDEDLLQKLFALEDICNVEFSMVPRVTQTNQPSLTAIGSQTSIDSSNLCFTMKVSGALDLAKRSTTQRAGNQLLEIVFAIDDLCGAATLIPTANVSSTTTATPTVSKTTATLTSYTTTATTTAYTTTATTTAYTTTATTTPYTTTGTATASTTKTTATTTTTSIRSLQSCPLLVKSRRFTNHTYAVAETIHEFKRPMEVPCDSSKNVLCDLAWEVGPNSSTNSKCYMMQGAVEPDLRCLFLFDDTSEVFPEWTFLEWDAGSSPFVKRTFDNPAGQVYHNVPFQKEYFNLLSAHARQVAPALINNILVEIKSLPEVELALDAAALTSREGVIPFWAVDAGDVCDPSTVFALHGQLLNVLSLCDIVFKPVKGCGTAEVADCAVYFATRIGHDGGGSEMPFPTWLYRQWDGVNAVNPKDYNWMQPSVWSAPYYLDYRMASEATTEVTGVRLNPRTMCYLSGSTTLLSVEETERPSEKNAQSVDMNIESNTITVLRKKTE
eukprot:GHVQ01036710.1.p1 GENE.GHVQ01036710.1~~GHVQ01036710.1.p1  ORF type:complete len:619 (-),score=79.99 GHVQ01036710.1:166-2022(-)